MSFSEVLQTFLMLIWILWMMWISLIPTALEQFRFDAEKPAISKACGDLIGSD